MLTDRQLKIICELTEFYVKDGKPVSSKELADTGKFVCSPATLRNEMHYLMEQGFLEQPYTSAGRIPTTRGYRLWIEQRKERFSLPRRILNKLSEIKRHWFRKPPSFLAHSLSHLSKTLVILETEYGIVKEGWEEVLKREEFLEREFLKEFLDWTEKIEYLFEQLEEEITVRIGEEIARNSRLGLLGVRLPSSRKVKRVLLIGPKRLHYLEKMRVLEFLRR